MASLAGSKRTFTDMDGDLSTLRMSALEHTTPYTPRIDSRQSTSRSPKQSLQRVVKDVWKGQRSSSSSPVPSCSQLPQARCFGTDASIVLVGFRGTGKSTLAIIISMSLQRRLIDTDYKFLEITGMSSSVYKKQHGNIGHHKRQAEILQTVLANNPKGCVIVVGTSLLDQSMQGLLRDHSKTHPIINVIRDPNSIQKHLKGWDNKRIGDLLSLSRSIFRRCSNYEFFNISEPSKAIASPDRTDGVLEHQRHHSPHLGLKRAERHWLKFIALTTSANSIRALEAAYPLSQVRTEARQYTYAVSVATSALLSGTLDIEGLETGADAFEVVVSAPANKHFPSYLDDISEACARARRDTIVPIIYHVDGRNFALDGSNNHTTSTLTDSNAYCDLVRHGFRLSASFVSIDLSLKDEDIAPLMAIRGSCKVIGHFSADHPQAPGWHDMDYWTSMYTRARELSVDVVRFCRPATSLEDNDTIQCLRYRLTNLPGATVPLSMYNTGPLGRVSVCTNPVLSPVTHEDLSIGGPTSNTPLITSCQASEALYACFVYDPMRMNIIGSNTGYSLSPAMHNAAYKACGMPHTYSIHQALSLNELHKLVEDPQYGGSSVTLPFKVEVIALTHSLSSHARTIGAINTLIPVRNLRPDGSIPDELSLFRERNRAGPVKALYGENTDWIGVKACLRRGLSPANAVGPRTSAIVIGAGGMARAAIYALIQMGVPHILIHNRTMTRAEELADHYRRVIARSVEPNPGPSSTLVLSSPQDTHTVFHVLQSRDDEWPERFRQPTIVVSCVPTHAIGDSPPSDFTMPQAWMKSPTGGVVLEVAYKSLDTPLMNQVRAEAHRGWVAMDGLDLLPEQGFAQFELFTGRRAPRRLMRLEVLRNYKDDTGKTDLELIRSRLERVNEQEP